MEPEFWYERWQHNEIGFHAAEANPLLVAHWGALSLVAGDRVFVPLCGKTLDIGWLLSQGYRVVGAELSEKAVQELFAELGLVPEISELDELRCYRGNGVDVFVGDIFDLTQGLLGEVQAIYDRAALVAMPFSMRRRYTAHLRVITATAPQLLLCFEYDQRAMDGPPFSISDEEVARHYAGHYDLLKLASVAVTGGLKGQCAARENVWLLNQAVVG